MARKSKTPSPTSPLDSVTELMAERAKFEQWLEDLEGKKNSTPAKVFDRVHKDYLSRLQGVMDQLKAHSETLQTHAAALNKQLIELSSAEESRMEERYEAELRANVGEMTPAEWELVSKRADKELAKLKQDQEVIETDLDQIQAILEELGGGAPARASAAIPAANVDEMEFLKSVVGTAPRPGDTPPTPPAASTPATPPTAAAAPAPAAEAPSPARISSPAQPAPRTSAPVQPPSVGATPATGTVAQPAPAAPPSPPAAAAPPPAVAAPPAPDAPAAPAAPIVGKPTPTADAPKTLKCQECSTMNYPSEWYCERCGAELTIV